MCSGVLLFVVSFGHVCSGIYDISVRLTNAYWQFFFIDSFIVLLNLIFKLVKNVHIRAAIRLAYEHRYNHIRRLVHRVYSHSNSNNLRLTN